MSPTPRIVLLGLLAALLMAPAAKSYSKFEHEQLTYYAFELARQSFCETASARPEVCAAFGDRSAPELGKVSAADLGGVTRAVDYFSHPWRLAPEAGACLDKKLANDENNGCRASLADKCQKACSSKKKENEAQGGSPETAASRCKKACLDIALADTLERVQNRRNKKLWRALAVHRNDEHFREGAQEQYNRMHERAIELAGEGHPALALVAEAVAIHFLQDGFAPGHLAAPRDQYGDSYAGSLHDRFNSRGLPIWVDDDVCHAAAGLIDPLTELARPDTEGERTRLRRGLEQITSQKYWGPEGKPKAERKTRAAAQPVEPLKQIPLSKQIPLEDLLTDIEEFADPFCTSGKRSYDALGDKLLLAGKKSTRAADTPASSQSLHRASLLALSVESIEDVLGADRDEPRLRLCFHQPSIGPPASEGCGSGTEERFWAPGLAVGRSATDWPRERACWKCSQRELLFGFRTEPAPYLSASPAGTAVTSSNGNTASNQFRYATLPAGIHQVNGLQVAVSYIGEKRRRFEFAHDLVATEQYLTRSENGELGSKVGRQAFGSGGYSVHYEKDRDLEVSGAGLLYSIGIQHRDLDYYASIEPGIGYYQFPGGTSTRYRWSLRAGVGLSVFAFEAILERGYESVGEGRLEKEWRPSINARFRLAPSWLSWPFNR